jgi:ubiquinone/menaquinone biosynthesis C-methylase UbiE
MGLYHDRLLPWLIDRTMRSEILAPYRRQAVAPAAGRVLEVGIGSGQNVGFYGVAAATVVGIDVSGPLLARAMARAAGEQVGRTLHLVRAAAGGLPFAEASFDAAVLTWTLCSIADPAAALAEIRRVLKPGGLLHYVEHGRAPEPGVHRLQDRLTPLWRRLAGGCHLNREVAALIASAGFRLTRQCAGYAPGPRIVAYFYLGCAVAAGG